MKQANILKTALFAGEIMLYNYSKRHTMLLKQKVKGQAILKILYMKIIKS